MKIDFIKIISLISNVIFIVFIGFLLNHFGAFNQIKKEIPGLSNSKMKIINDESLKSRIATDLNSQKFNCDKCEQVFDIGEGYDDKLGKVNVLWVSCDQGNKVTIKTEINPLKAQSEIVTLFYYGWIE